MGSTSAPDPGGHRSTDAGRTVTVRPAGRRHTMRTCTGPPDPTDPVTPPRDGVAPDGPTATVTPLVTEPADAHAPDTSIDRHPTALGRRLDTYLGAVTRELRDRGVLTGTPQRTGPEHRLIGSIVLDCTSLRIAARTPTGGPAGRRYPGASVHPERPAPVIAIWDEHDGWCVGLHHDPSTASRRYLHPDLLPAAQTVAGFVVGLAVGRVAGAGRPITARAGPGRARLHVARPPR